MSKILFSLDSVCFFLGFLLFFLVCVCVLFWTVFVFAGEIGLVEFSTRLGKFTNTVKHKA